MRMLVGALLVALVAGCSSGVATPREPVRTVVTPTATSTPTPPAPLALPSTITPSGFMRALIFVRHYIDLINFAQATGQSRPLKAVERPDCKSCKTGRANLDSIYARGGHIIGGAIKATLISVAPDRGRNRWVVRLHLSYGPQVISRPWATPRDQHLTGGHVKAVFMVRGRGDRWVMMDWFRTP